MINSMLIHLIGPKSVLLLLLILVICTLDSIDSIKSLKRSPQHIFVEFMHSLIVLGPGSGVQVPESNFRVPSSGLRTLFHG
ncbi:hypothetical protein Avbf_02652 [Armadillidium vulgare]|nr:hypothetical protein Avbf_02652 [Armadillidium vulgare]